MNRIGRYEIQDKLGQGGMGMVFRAHDTVLNRMVALKILRGDRIEHIERLFREARIAAKLKHEHIVAVHDVGTADGHHYIAMELVEGISLEDAKLPVRDALDLIRRAAEAVQHAHDQGVIHRDLKPGNILLGPDGRPKVADFGMAKQEAGQSSLSAEGAIVGTPNYMSPEQASGRAREADVRSDVWSLGATLYHLIAGRPPYEGEEAMDVVLKILQTNPEPLPKVHRDIQTIVMKCLERKPKDRYATASELASDLTRYLDGEPILARPVRWWVRRKKAIAAVAILAVAVGIADQIRGHREDQSRALVAEENRRRIEREETVARAQMEEARRYRELQEMLQPLEGEIREARPYLYVAGADVGMSGLKSSLARFAAAEARFSDYPEYGSALGRGLYLVGDLAGAERALQRSRDPAAELLLARIRIDQTIATLTLMPRREAMSSASAQSMSRGALEALKGRADADPMEVRIGEAYFRYLDEAGDLSGVRRLCEEAMEEFRGRLGVEEFHLLLALSHPAPQTIPILENALRMRPHFPLALQVLCTSYINVGRYADAKAGSEIGMRYEGWSPFFLTTRGFAKAFEQDYRGAKADFEAALKENPEHYEAWHGLGVAWRELGEPKKALDSHSEAIRLRPELANGYAKRSSVHVQMGNIDAALADADTAVRLNPKLSEAWEQRADVQFLKGDWKSLVDDATQAIATDPSAANAYNLRGIGWFMLGDFTRALADYDRSLFLAPGMPRVHRNRGDVYTALKDYRKAHDEYTLALEHGDRQAGTFNNRAVAAIQLRDWAGAVSDLLEAIRRTPEGAPERERLLDLLKRIP